MTIYLDNNATTQIDPQVFEAMRPFFEAKYGNPSSLHPMGNDAKAAVEDSRSKIASLIGASPDEIIFTSCATEANNIAIKGVARRYSERGKHIITCVTEHKSVLEPCQGLIRDGFNVTFLTVLPDGLIDVETLRKEIREDTILISIMHVNNEIGVIQPIEEVGRIAKEMGIFFHSDCSQSCGKIQVNVDKLGCDLLTISGHKMHGPKGVGALYVRKFAPRVKLGPLMEGGGQENGLRPGTLNVPLIVGLAKAFEMDCADMIDEQRKIRELRDYLMTQLLSNLDEVYINGSLKSRVAGNLSTSFRFIEGENLVKELNDSEIIVSTGSACSEAVLEHSHVLKALGLSEDLIHNTIRFGFCRFNTLKDVEYVVRVVVDTVRRLRAESPSYQNYVKGVKK